LVGAGWQKSLWGPNQGISIPDKVIMRQCLYYMPILINPEDTLFDITDIFGKHVRTTREYWMKIKKDKHQELIFEKQEAVDTLVKPDEVYRSVRDEYIKLFYKKFATTTLVVVVKYLNGDGFVVTAYQTSKVKRKGEKLWPK